MGALPLDLEKEILSRTPVRSLLKYRCVCKSWNCLIRSPDFIKNHLKHHSTKKHYILSTHSLEYQPIAILSLHSYDSFGLISQDFHIPDIGIILFSIELSGPCNGLICISINKQHIMLCNPFLREFKLLQPRPFPSPDKYWFDQAIGFEFDSCTGDYKVVRIVKQGFNEPVLVAEVYEFSNHSWRQLENHMLEEHQLDLSPGTNWNGIVHWVNCNKEILSFDMKTEIFQWLNLPSDPLEEGKLMSLTLLNEFLAAFAWTDAFDPKEQLIGLWKMEDYGVEKSWTKLFTIGPLVGIQAPLLLSKDEDNSLEGFELPLDEDHPPGKVLTYTVDTLKKGEFQIIGRPYSFRSLICNESLVSLSPF